MSVCRPSGRPGRRIGRDGPLAVERVIHASEFAVLPAQTSIAAGSGPWGLTGRPPEGRDVLPGRRNRKGPARTQPQFGGFSVSKIRTAAVSICVLALAFGATLTAHGVEPQPPATPKAQCRPGDLVETDLQGRVPRADVTSGRAFDGYTCNTDLVGRFGNTGVPGGAGGYRVHRYVDGDGHECAYMDSSLLFPLNAPTQQDKLTGVYVLDMSDPANPTKTANLVTPAMLTPHESLSLNESRGLLAAGMGNPLTNPGFVDIYDVSQDCRHPVLLSSTPFGIFGHEGSFSPDGNTFWVTSTQASLITALDVSDPALPRILWRTTAYRPHGLNISDDGKRLYLADTTSGSAGLTILDVSQVQARTPNPVVEQVSHMSWGTVSIPQTAIPITIGGSKFIVEVDEFSSALTSGSTNGRVGAARIINIDDESAPVVASDLRLEVNQPANWATTSGDPGASFFLQGYTGHYCSVPQRDDPTIVACSFILSGLRVFDIRDPYSPKELAYFNGPLSPTHEVGTEGGSFAMSAPAFDEENGDIWYADGNSGFYAVHLDSSVWPESP